MKRNPLMLCALISMLLVGCAEDKKSNSDKSELPELPEEISSETPSEMPRVVPEGPAPKRYGQKRTLYPYPLYGDVETIEVVNFSTGNRRGQLRTTETVVDTIRFNSRGDVLEHAGEFCEGMRERFYYIYDDFGNNLLTLNMSCWEGPYNVEDPYGYLSFSISNDRNGGIASIYFDENGEFEPESLRSLAGYGGYVYSESEETDQYKNERDKYKYDEKGREIEYIHYAYDGDVLNVRTTTYNSQGKKARVVNSGPYFWIGDAYSCGAESLPKETVYSYDENGYLVEETSIFEGEDYVNGRVVKRSVYSYDHKYNLIENRISYDSRNGDSGTRFNIKYR